MDRAACERRVYRLATLLTGNPIAATKVIAQVVDAQPDLRNLDSTHLDRLTVLRSREIKPAAIVDDLVPQLLSQALASLTPQQREAWVFTRVYRLTGRETASAMDCSVQATQRHLEQADAAMQRPDPVTSANDPTQALLSYSMSLDVPNFYRIERRRRRHTRLALLALGIAGAAIAIAALVLWWVRPLSMN